MGIGKFIRWSEPWELAIPMPRITQKISLENFISFSFLFLLGLIDPIKYTRAVESIHQWKINSGLMDVNQLFDLNSQHGRQSDKRT